ncbi:MAG TPA: TonB-dependent receptor, partial [Gammaproteobacteria bacterium]|nr:TonB-dependent receptor [Gammaproteobacteria bacterium]
MENRKLISQAVRYALAAGVAASVTGIPLAASAAPAPLPQPATASGAQTLGTIEVTGSRIKRTDVETAQPVLQIDRQTIENTGIQNVGQLLQTITSAGAALNTVFNNGGNGNTNVDLRYLGAQRVLVLVDGHRIPTGLNGTVNLNIVPIAIVDHIEVLQDGASAIYGSDAISGVVNIITRKDFNGATASAYYGKWNGQGSWDGATQEFDFSIGTSNDHSGVFFSSQYFKQEPLSAGDRDYASTPFAGLGNIGGSSGTPQGRFIFIAPGSVAPVSAPIDPKTGKPADGPLGTGLIQPDPNVTPLGGLTSAQCPTTDFGSDKLGHYYVPYCDLTLKTGATGTSAADFRPFTANDAYNFAPINYLLTPLEVTSLYVAGHYDLAPNLTFQSNVMYSHQVSQQHLAATPLFITPGSIQGNIPASKTPFGFDLNTTQPGGGYQIPNLFLIGRREIGAGPRIANEERSAYSFEGGFVGNFLLGNHEWDWDASYVFGRGVTQSHSTGLFNTQNLLYAIDGCPDQAVVPASGLDCVPYNMFNGAANVTPAQAAYATYLETSLGSIDQRIYDANITTSDLFDLPAGGLGLAVGYEYREQNGEFLPSAIDIEGNSSSFPTVNVQPTSGRYNVNSAYAELNIPLLANLPGARLVSLDLANRWFKYDTFGSGSAGRAGLKWQPFHDLLLRATWSEGFRAPSISNLFGGQLANFPAVSDPCNGGGTTAIEQTNCAGVPASYNQPNAQIREIVGGNPDLQPETSISRSAGFVYSPGWMPGLSVNLDYYKIELENTIQAVGEQNLLNFCYTATARSFCDRITRSATGVLTRVLDTATNIGGTLTEGFDGGIQYKFPSTGFGDFTGKLNSTYVQRYDLFFPTATGGRTATHVAGTGGAGNGFGNGIPHYKTNLEVDWAYGGFNAALIGHYVSHQTEACGKAGHTPLSQFGVCTYPTDNKNNIGAATWWDIQVGYDFAAANTSLTFGVINL